MHFDEGESKLFSFGEDVVAPGVSDQGSRKVDLYV
jgi:hypothetical protein